jgi:NADPH:quinone reductase-like Zn-dependent oxidoreductase
MTYKRIVVSQHGGPEMLQVVERERCPPAKGQVRVKVLAAPVCAPDVQARYGQSPFPPRLPFTPGYAIVGDVEALGPAVAGIEVGDRVAALTVVDGYAEAIYLDADQLLPLSRALPPAQVAPLLLNYIVAYQTLHRSARVQAGDRVLIIGASGGIGTALLEVGRLAGLKMYGLASRAKHHVVERFGATPIDYRSEDFVEVMRQMEPEGLDAVLDGMIWGYLDRGFALLKRGGTWVQYGNPLSRTGLLKLLARVVLYNLRPNGRRLKIYGTSTSKLGRRAFLEDWATLFQLLEEGRIQPIIDSQFPLLEAAAANRRLESGDVIGNIVLLAPELWPAEAHRPVRRLESIQ